MSETTKSHLSAAVAALLEDVGLKIWHGIPANVAAEQAALPYRAECNALAVSGKYSQRAESQGAQTKGTT